MGQALCHHPFEGAWEEVFGGQQQCTVHGFRSILVPVLIVRETPY